LILSFARKPMGARESSHLTGMPLRSLAADLRVLTLLARISARAFAAFTYEVRRDIFTLSTLGATPDQVFLVFVTLAAVVGFAGGAIGYLTGMAAFRALNLVGARVPVDVKLGLFSLLSTTALSTLLALTGALAPASKAVVAAVPSLRGRWAVEAEELGRDEAKKEVVFATTIPVVIRNEQRAKEYTDFIYAKLSELAELKASVFDVRKWVERGSPWCTSSTCSRSRVGLSGRSISLR